MKNLIILDKNDLRDLLKEMLPAVKYTKPKEPGKPYLTINEGLLYLNDRGIKMAKSTLYKYTGENNIPFKRFGDRKIVFVREELDEWIDEKLSGNDNTLNKAV